MTRMKMETKTRWEKSSKRMDGLELARVLRPGNACGIKPNRVSDKYFLIDADHPNLNEDESY